MKKDNDIRSFFKSSADKKPVLGSQIKQVVEISKEKVMTKPKEDNARKIEANIETKQKKGKKRKGAQCLP